MATLQLDENKVDVPDGEPVKEFAKELDIPFGCESGFCGTCLVEVEDGAENLAEKTDAEKEFGLEENQRLCCQMKIKSGLVQIRGI